MNLNKLFLIFGIILALFIGIVFYQYRGTVLGSKSPKSTATINEQTFNVEIADTPDKQQLGLSGRKSLPQKQGMLFEFEEKGFHTFWMKDMKFPIDIIFIEDDKIVSITKNAPPPKPEMNNLPLYKPTGPINKVLEINSGLSEKYNIKSGDKIQINLE